MATTHKQWFDKLNIEVKNIANAPLDIVMVGDSIMEGYGADQLFGNWPNQLQMLLQAQWPVTSIGTTRRGFYNRRAKYKFIGAPDPLTEKLSGTGSDQNIFGFGRLGQSQGLNTSRSWTDNCTSMGVRIYAKVANHSFEIWVDGVRTQVVTSTTAGEIKEYRTAVMPYGKHTVEVKFTNNTLPIVDCVAIYSGTETKGVRVWESGRSGSIAGEFTPGGPNQSGNPAGGWVRSLKDIQPQVIMLGHLTNDSNASNGNRTVAQYKDDMRRLIQHIRSVVPDSLILIQTPQERRAISQPQVAGTTWQQYVDAQRELESEFDYVLVESMTEHGIPKSVGYPTDKFIHTDQIHPNTPGYAKYADVTLKTITGVYEGSTGNPGGGDPGDTTGPSVTITSPAVGAVVTGTVKFRATITDASGIAFVAVYSGSSTLVGSMKPLPAEGTDVWGLDREYDDDDFQGLNGWRIVAKDTLGYPTSTPTRAMTVAVKSSEDIAAPTITNIKPLSGTNLLGDVVFSADVTTVSPQGIDSVAFSSTSNALGAAKLVTGNTYQLTLNVNKLPDGMNRFAVAARGKNGVGVASSEVYVTVGATKDTTPPTVKLTSPINGEVLGETVKFSAEATDSQSGVASVTFLSGTTVLAEGTLANGVWTADMLRTDIIKLVPNISSVTAKAVDGTEPVGNAAVSAPVTVKLPTGDGDKWLVTVDSSTFLPPVQTLQALSDYFKLANGGSTELVLWGDSLTQNWSNGTNLVAIQQAFGADSVTNRGVSGQTSQQIAARQGGWPTFTTVTGGSIPASSAVGITPDVNFLYIGNQTGGTRTANAVIAGVPGVVTMVKTADPNATFTYTFTRDTAGVAVAVPGTVPILTGYEDRNKVMVISLGRNDYATAGTAEAIVPRIRGMIEWNTRNRNDHIIRLFPASQSETLGTANRTTLNAVNDAIRRNFPRNVVDEPAWFLSENALLAEGITATATDKQNISEGVTPLSLRIDTLHYNAAAYAIINKQILAEFRARGIIA